ncbi:hypothetical protein vseg_016106 [Gypsophila vaccaria]
MREMHEKDASGNHLLQDVGLWISHKIKDYFNQKMWAITLKYIGLSSNLLKTDDALQISLTTVFIFFKSNIYDPGDSGQCIR